MAFDTWYLINGKWILLKSLKRFINSSLSRQFDPTCRFDREREIYWNQVKFGSKNGFWWSKSWPYQPRANIRIAATIPTPVCCTGVTLWCCGTVEPEVRPQSSFNFEPTTVSSQCNARQSCNEYSSLFF